MTYSIAAGNDFLQWLNISLTHNSYRYLTKSIVEEKGGLESHYTPTITKLFLQLCTIMINNFKKNMFLVIIKFQRQIWCWIEKKEVCNIMFIVEWVMYQLISHMYVWWRFSMIFPRYIFKDFDINDIILNNLSTSF